VAQISLPNIAPGFDESNVAGLREAAEAAHHYELLRGLTSAGEEDFILRFAVIADLAHADQTLWTLDALERRLCWLAPERSLSVLRALRRSGWLESLGTAGYRLTSDALAVYATICRLGSLRTGREDDLAMGVFDLEASTRLDEDKGPALRHLQHHLRRSIEDVEAAVASQSELKVMEAREKLDKNLQWSQRARRLLDDVDVEEEREYRSAQRLGRDLSELHRWHSVMQRMLDEVGRYRTPMGALGVRQADVDRYLAGLQLDQLVALGADAVTQPPWPVVGILDNILSAAEYELLYAEHPEQRQVGWRTGEAESAEIGELAPSHGELAFQAFERQMGEVVAVGEDVPLERFLLAGDFPRTCYRMTLLALEDEQGAGRVTIALRDEPGRRLFTDYASEISSGVVRPRGKRTGTDDE